MSVRFSDLIAIYACDAVALSWGARGKRQRAGRSCLLSQVVVARVEEGFFFYPS